jgi:hypothetical protein
VRGQRHALAALYPRERPGTHFTGPVWTGAENLAPTGIRPPDCPARSLPVTIPTTLPGPPEDEGTGIY